MNIDIEFFPTWKLNFEDLPIKINSTNLLINGSAYGYSATMVNTTDDDKGEINLSYRDIEDIEKVKIDSFITEDMKVIGLNAIPLHLTSMPVTEHCKPIDETWIPIIEEKLKEKLA